MTGVGTSTGQFDWGSTLIMTAVPNAGYVLYEWRGGLTPLNPTSAVVVGGLTLTAEFKFADVTPPPEVPRDFWPNYSDINQRLTRQVCCGPTPNRYTSYSQKLNTMKARLNGNCCPYSSISLAYILGGSGFTGGDLLRLNGGAPYGTAPTIISISMVSGAGAITEVDLSSGGYYYTKPTAPYSLSVVRAGITTSAPSLTGATIQLFWSDNANNCVC
jgi:hypothetical protein